MTKKPPPRRESQYPAYQPKSARRDYDFYAPGSGYTPPFKAPEPPPPPKNFFQRSRDFWRSYRGMGQRARDDSMVWWGYKLIQGLLFGGSLLAAGVLVIIFSTVMGHIFCLDGAGIAAVIGGIVLLIYYAAAPVTQKWIVFVPENHFCVVVDRTGVTLEFIGPGRMHVEWQRGSKVHDYVNFRWLTVKTRLDGLVRLGAYHVSLEIDVMMDFNPVNALSGEYARLRSLDAQPKFEAMIVREVERAVRYHLNRMPPAQQQHLIYHPNLIEDLIAHELGQFATLGLTFASSTPVSVYVHGAPPRSDNPPAAPFAGRPSEEPTQPKMPTPPPRPPDQQDTIPAALPTAGPPTRERAPDDSATRRHTSDLTRPATLPPAPPEGAQTIKPPLRQPPADPPPDISEPAAPPPDTPDSPPDASEPPRPALRTSDDLIDPLALRRRSRRPPTKG